MNGIHNFGEFAFNSTVALTAKEVLYSIFDFFN